MERWTDKKRSYPDGTFPSRTNALSFIASQREELGGIDQTQVADGEATVKRFGKYEQVYYKPEEKEVSLAEPGIILSSAQKECYLIQFKVNKTFVEVKSQVKKIHLPHTVFFADTFVNPDENSLLSLADTVEICPFIYTLDYKKFIIVIGGNSGGLTLKARDDWHFNNCQNLAELPPLEDFRWYYYSWFPVEVRQSDQYVQGWGWNYGFSPFSYYQGLTYLNRFIDHNKRLYIPILGRGDAFAKAHPKLAGCENGRYGKKPFTITKDGMVSWKEVVTLSDAVPSPEGYGPSKYYGYNMQTYWPFIPYMFEISNLNIQGGKRNTSLWYPAFFFNYKMQYYDQGGMHELSLRSDIINGSFPAPVNAGNSDIGIVEGVDSSSGTNTVTGTRSQTSSLHLKKYTSIGTIGNLKDLHVVTELEGNMSSGRTEISIVHRDSNFPEEYYDISFLDDLFWSGGPYHDETNCSMDVNINHTNKISGTQKLMAGVIEIDSGIISLDFAGTEGCHKTHNGTTDWTAPPCTHIGYTTLQMSVNTTQQFAALDADNAGVVVPPGSWSASIGSITDTGLYTAPASNPGCANAVITLKCLNVSPSITIAINASGATSIGDVKRCISERTCVSNGSQTPPRYDEFCPLVYGMTINCDGTEVYNHTCIQGNSSNRLVCDFCASIGRTTCEESALATSPYACATAGYALNQVHDTRTDAQKLAGCCPAQLL